jgi:hypothetical protein
VREGVEGGSGGREWREGGREGGRESAHREGGEGVRDRNCHELIQDMGEGEVSGLVTHVVVHLLLHHLPEILTTDRDR